jgi:hypothetical protein
VKSQHIFPWHGSSNFKLQKSRTVETDWAKPDADNKYQNIKTLQDLLRSALEGDQSVMRPSSLVVCDEERHGIHIGMEVVRFELRIIVHTVAGAHRDSTVNEEWVGTIWSWKN